MFFVAFFVAFFSASSSEEEAAAETKKAKDKKKADAAMAALLEEEDAEAEKKATKNKQQQHKKKKKKKTKEKKEEEEAEEGVPVSADPSNLPSTHLAAASVDIAAEEAEAALHAALETDGDLEALVAAINAHADHASPELLKVARDTRDQVKHRRKKALKKEKAKLDKRDRAEALLPLLAAEEDISLLQDWIAEAHALAGVLPALDAGLEEAKERMVDLCAAMEAKEVDEECVVCMDAPKAVVLIPCGHQCVCEACAETVPIGGDCPYCQTTVTAKWANPMIFK